MIELSRLKPLILSEHFCIRERVMDYIHEGFIQDDEILPLTLQACREFGIERNRRLLFFAEHQQVNEPMLDELLILLEQSRYPNAKRYLGTLIHRAPFAVLDSQAARIESNRGKLGQAAMEFIQHRRRFSGLDDSDLWAKLQRFSDNAEKRNLSYNQLDHNYINALIAELGHRSEPAEDRVCELLTGLSEDSFDWLHIYLVMLAGRRKMRNTVPTMVDMFAFDTDYLLEECSKSLVRIGDPLAAELIREQIPEHDFYYWNYALGVLGDMKHPACETAILGLRKHVDVEDHQDFETRLCFSLCSQFSPKAFDWARQLVDDPVGRQWDDYRPYLIIIADLHGFDLPERERWLVELEREQLVFESSLDSYLNPAKPRNRSRRKSGLYQNAYPLGDDDPDSLEPRFRVGPNNPCPCGSGKKFKKCCGKL